MGWMPALNDQRGGREPRRVEPAPMPKAVVREATGSVLGTAESSVCETHRRAQGRQTRG